MNRSWLAGVAVVVVCLGAACETHTEVGGGRGVVFPIQQRTNMVLEAQLEGTLVERRYCLYVLSDDGGLKLPTWPQGFSYRTTANDTIVRDAHGEMVARTGSHVTMGGGETPRRHPGGPAQLRSKQAPCHGPYWLVGEIAPAS